MNRISIGALAVTILLQSHAAAQEQFAAKELAKLAAPGPEHDRLKALEGTWFLMLEVEGGSAGQPGTAIYKSVLGGRFVTEAVRRGAIDGTGLSAIEDLADDLRDKGRTLVICGAPSQPLSALSKAELHSRLGGENICSSVQAALDRAAAIVRPMRSDPANSASIGTTPPSR